MEYYEEEKEILIKVESLVIMAKDGPLREVLASGPLSKVSGLQGGKPSWCQC